ncbi:MAG: SixA phosphatase family protein [Rickettsiales bacterium]
MALQKTLTILRHAKAETGDAGQDDKERGLAERGEMATKIVGAHLVQCEVNPDLVLCSDATRTVKTLRAVEQVYARPLQVRYEPRLYLASANEMLNLIAEVPDEVQHLMLVGHNPGMHELAMKLSKEGEEEVIDRLAIKFPTCAVARFNCYGPDWKTLADSRTRLIDFSSPKMLGQIIQ